MSNVPSHYHPGSRLSLHLESGSTTATVMEFFTPFTQSQVLLVQPDTDAPAHLPRCPLILKVYDSRYLDDRLRVKYETTTPWSYEAEAEAIRQMPKADRRFNFCTFLEDDDVLGWELHYYQMVENSFLRESESYKRLQSLQGKGIPHCYGAGRLPLEGRPYFPHILLLEYIPNTISLDDYDTPKQHRPMAFSVMQSLVNTVHAFAEHGVGHVDLSPRNILLTPRDNPTHGVVIDFGEAYYRENESDEEWRAKVASFWDVGSTIRYFRKRVEFRDTLWPPGVDRRSW